MDWIEVFFKLKSFELIAGGIVCILLIVVAAVYYFIIPYLITPMISRLKNRKRKK